MKNRSKVIIIIAFFLILCAALGCWQYQKNEQARALKAQQEAEAAAKAEAERLAREKLNKKIQELETEAGKITGVLDKVNSDEMLCDNPEEAAAVAEQVLADIKTYRTEHSEEDQEAVESSLEMLKEAEETAQMIQDIKSIDETLSAIYSFSEDSVAMSTAKNDKIFREVQTEIWKVQDTYPKKLEQYEKAISRISDEWNYVNDEWNYETSTLKVTVEPRETSYTKYWICRIKTFSPAQLRSALNGGTYGNPRTPTSEEVAAHNGVIGVNGSGFSYGSGIPAEGKSMIKEGKVYNDVYSNGNIMCVTSDGGMFTAIAGMTTEEMLNRSVIDTYCFGPTLVENGQRYEISGDFNQTYRYQRTAVGMVSPGDYYIVVVDGKGAGGSEGMTYEEIQDVFLDLNCQYAYMMDGGGSTTLVFKGRIINSLTDGGRERPVADILYFIDAGDGGEGDDIVIHEDEAMLRPSSGN